MQRPHNFETRFDAAWPARDWRDAHVVLAVSGGADSVAMLRAAVSLKAAHGGSGTLFVGHLNHQLRPEADADAAWVEGLCGELGVAVEIGRADVAGLAAEQGDGVEAAARGARYEFLRRTSERLGARFVAVAQNEDDQIETILHRLVRGTGLAGLVGIPRVRPLSPGVALVRPLLGIRRHEVLEYLQAIGQSFRTDASNVDPRFTRNRLRHELLPSLREKYNADVDAALLRLSGQAAEAQQLIEGLAAELSRDCVAVEFAAASVAEKPNTAIRVLVDYRKLASQPPLIIREVCKIAWRNAGWPLQAMGFHEWQQLAEMIRNQGQMPAISLPGQVRADRTTDVLVLERVVLA